MIHFSDMIIKMNIQKGEREQQNDQKWWVFDGFMIIKDKGEFWSSDCIVKEKVWNGSEKVDHVACKYWCVLQSSGVIKIIINLAQSW